MQFTPNKINRPAPRYAAGHPLALDTLGCGPQFFGVRYAEVTQPPRILTAPARSRTVVNVNLLAA